MDDRILKVYWSDDEKDFMIQYPRRCDGAFVQGKLFHPNMIFDLIKFNTETRYNLNILPYKTEDDFIEELERRGYDKTTLKFEIKLKDDIES